MIQPPPEIKLIADKTAKFIADHGDEIEAKLRNTNADNQKFRFLREGDPFMPYFRYMVQFYRNGGKPGGPSALEADAAVAEEQTTEAVKEEKEDEAPVETVTKAAVEDPLARAAKRIDKDREPAEPEFAIVHPTYLPPVDIDIMKLMAQYTAASGVSFLSAIAQKEGKNPQFDFLKPTHPQFQYFKSLVDSYKKILKVSSALRGRLHALEENKAVMLERAVHRAEWKRKIEEEKRLETAEDDADRVAYLQIDWHDFVVVETITFDDDAGEGAGAGAGAGVSGAAASAPASGAVSRPTATVAADDDDDGDMDMDMDDMDEDDGGDDEKLNIVTGYVPTVRAEAPAKATHFVDPRTGESIPIEQSAEHMRVNLLNPEHQANKEKYLERQKITAYTEGDNIADNLKSFAAARPDVFGSKRARDGSSAGEAPRKK